MIKKPAIIALLLLILAEACLVILLDLNLINAPAFPTFAVDSATAVQLIAPLLIITSLALTYLLFKYTEKEIEINNQRIYIDNLRESLENLRAQRHDFMSHLQVILGFLQLSMGEEARQYVQSLCSEISQPTRIISTNQPTLAALIRSKMGVAESKGITWQCEISSDLREFLVPGPVITRIFGNLLDNAIEACCRQTSGEKRLWLRLYDKEGEYVFEVGNTGPAIPLALQERIFEKGFTTKKEKEGHGQGLFIVKSLATGYNGKISIQSSEQATVFILSFPRWKELN
ncbi:MAG TPA: hypothetical protein DEA73_03715 [Peptococcaceae bacterium]|nr:hypothetical protein [Peptococcaceae bacterium]